MFKRTEGIVLKSALFGEADLLVTYLTRDHGIMTAFAKGPRKAKSRFGSSLEPLTHAKVSLLGKEDAGLPRLTQSDILHSFHTLREDFRCFSSLIELLELNLTFLPEREPNGRIFELFLDTLVNLEANPASPLLPLRYKMQFLQITGYSPKLDACGRCSRLPRRNGLYRFYLSQGSLLCRTCSDETGDSLELSESVLKFYRSLLQWHSSILGRIQAPESLLSEVQRVIDAHIRYRAGRPLKSMEIRETTREQVSFTGSYRAGEG